MVVVELTALEDGAATFTGVAYDLSPQEETVSVVSVGGEAICDCVTVCGIGVRRVEVCDRLLRLCDEEDLDSIFN